MEAWVLVGVQMVRQMWLFSIVGLELLFWDPCFKYASFMDDRFELSYHECWLKSTLGMRRHSSLWCMRGRFYFTELSKSSWPRKWQLYVRMRERLLSSLFFVVFVFVSALRLLAKNGKLKTLNQIPYHFLRIWLLLMQILIRLNLKSTLLLLQIMGPSVRCQLLGTAFFFLAG